MKINEVPLSMIRGLAEADTQQDWYHPGPMVTRRLANVALKALGTADYTDPRMASLGMRRYGTYNKYDPRTCSRPKEVARGARRLAALRRAYDRLDKWHCDPLPLTYGASVLKESKRRVRKDMGFELDAPPYMERTTSVDVSLGRYTARRMLKEASAYGPRR